MMGNAMSNATTPRPLFPPDHPIAIVRGMPRPRRAHVRASLKRRIRYLEVMIKEREAHGASTEIARSEIAALAAAIDLIAFPRSDSQGEASERDSEGGDRAL
jgi:hypothetical protein